MADEQADPLVTLLDKSGLSTAQKHGLWDLYTKAKNTDDLKTRLDSLQLPNAVKHDLWDLKAGESGQSDTTVAKPTTAEVSAGTWEDRGIGGMVWHPASGVKEGNRSDVQVLGMPPELATIGAARIGAAAAGAGLDLAGKAVAGGKVAISMAKPIVKFELIKHGLQSVGLPSTAAEIAAGVMVYGSYKRGVPAAAAETATAEGAAASTAAKQPFSTEFLRPSEPMEPSLDLTRRLKTEWRAMVAEQAKNAADKPKLTVEEMSLGSKLIRAGMKGEQALETILKRRELPKSWQLLPTDAEVAANVGARNASGAWPK